MKTAVKERFDMQEAKDFQPGEIVLNVGIVKQIYPHPHMNMVQILFNPSRGMVANGKFEQSHLMWYKMNDRLMKG